MKRRWAPVLAVLPVPAALFFVGCSTLESAALRGLTQITPAIGPVVNADDTGHLAFAYATVQPNEVFVQSRDSITSAVDTTDCTQGRTSLGAPAGTRDLSMPAWAPGTPSGHAFVFVAGNLGTSSAPDWRLFYRRHDNAQSRSTCQGWSGSWQRVLTAPGGSQVVVASAPSAVTVPSGETYVFVSTSSVIGYVVAAADGTLGPLHTGASPSCLGFAPSNLSLVGAAFYNGRIHILAAQNGTFTQNIGYASFDPTTVADYQVGQLRSIAFAPVSGANNVVASNCAVAAAATGGLVIGCTGRVGDASGEGPLSLLTANLTDADLATLETCPQRELFQLGPDRWTRLDVDASTGAQRGLVQQSIAVGTWREAGGAAAFLFLVPGSRRTGGSVQIGILRADRIGESWGPLRLTLNW